jgi:hypothetical protein
MTLRHAIVTALLTTVTSSQVSPVAKVIALLDGMKADIVAEGKSEAATYDKFACFCKETTATKATSVTDGGDTIDKLSAAIAENTATKQAGETKVQGLKSTKEALSKDLQDNTARCATEKAEYEALAADFNKAISSLKSAMKSMSDKQTAISNVKAASALLDTGSGLRETLQLADAMGLVKAPTQKAFLQASALLQQASSVDPADAGYKYHSQDIVDLLESLKKDFTEAKATLDTEHGKGVAACTNIKKSLAGKIETNTKETTTTAEKNNRLGASIAEDRGSLVEAQDLMKDDEAYLKSLTTRCENRAGEYDQRSSMRASEIEAISTALKVLGDRVKPADEEVNARVLLLTKKAAVAAIASPVVADKAASPTKKADVAKAGPAATPKTATVTKAAEPEVASAAKAVPSFLQKVSAHSQGDLSAQEAIAKDQAVDAIKNAGIHLKSPILTALAMQVAADPFKKVKQLIQGLVERLLRESAQEATKKGFCDTEVGKAEKDREFRWTRVKKLGAGIQVLQAKEDQLTEELASLTSALKVLDMAVKEDTNLRSEEKAENAKTLTTAREGLTAVNEALLLLRSFYRESAKAAFLQASPVDEDTAGAGFSGAYKGKQQSSNAVLALLETIASDFERTIRATESSEDSAAKQHVKFQRVTKADIGGKTTKKELNEQDLETTKNNLKVDRADMKTNMDLVDDAVKTLMELKPTCIDTGMSFSERTQKREEEVKALKNALCILDTEKVEDDCK